MKQHIILAAAIATALAGCATTGTFPGSKPATAKPTVSADEKAEARRSAFKAGAKGCGTAAAMTVGLGVLGKVLGIGGGPDLASAALACGAAGVTTGIADYRNQLDQFRALKGKVTVGAVVSVKERDVQVAGETTKAAESLTLNLDAKKVAARHADISRVIGELVAVLNKQTMPITASVSGNASDRAWVAAQLRAQVKNDKVTITDAAGSAPVIVVSPVPVIK